MNYHFGRDREQNKNNLREMNNNRLELRKLVNNNAFAFIRHFVI